MSRPRVLLRLSRGEKAYGERVLFTQAELRLHAQERAVLVGPNGAGKTTLLRLLLSHELPDEGERTLGHGVSTTYLDQHYHGLTPDLPLFAQFAARFGEARAAALLGRMGFRPPHWHDAPRSFSGGERARAGLALLGALRARLLVMDEPTNHIELELLEALERALADYPGTLVFVSHDRELVQKVATRFWGLEDGVLVEYPTYTEAEAAMLGKPAVRLNPYGETTLEEEGSEEEQDLEQAPVALMERLYEPGLSDRARLRLRADLLALEEALYRRYAREYFQPHPYRHRVRQEGLEVFTDQELSLWQFWSREEFCWGQLSQGVLLLEDPPSPRLLRAVLHIAFELEDIQVVRVGRRGRVKMYV